MRDQGSEVGVADLKQFYPFSLFDDDFLSKLALSSRARSLNEGDTLIGQGELIDTVFLVTEGALVTSWIDSQGDRQGRSCEPGSLVNFGSLLYAASTPFSPFTVSAEEDRTQIIEIAREAIELVIDAGISEDLEKRELQSILSMCPDNEVITHFRKNSDLYTSSNVHVCNEEGQIFQEGDPSGDVFVVINGQVRITKLSASGREQDIAMVREGQLFGELGAVTMAPRAGSAYSVGNATVMRIDGFLYQRMLSNDPSVAEMVERQQSLYRDASFQGSEKTIFGKMRDSAKAALLKLSPAMVSGITAFTLSSGVIWGSLYVISNDYQAQQLETQKKWVSEQSNVLRERLLEVKDAARELGEAALKDYAGGKAEPIFHREAKVYFLPKGVTLPLPVHPAVEETITMMRSKEGAADGQFHEYLIDNDAPAFLRVTEVAADGEVAGHVISLFTPGQTLPGNLKAFTVSGSDVDHDDGAVFGDVYIGGEASKRFRIQADIVDPMAEKSQQLALLWLLLPILVALLVFKATQLRMVSAGNRMQDDVAHSLDRLARGQRGLVVPHQRDPHVGGLARAVADLQDTLAMQEASVSQRMIDQLKKGKRQKEIQTSILLFQEQINANLKDLEIAVSKVRQVGGKLDDGTVSSAKAIDQIISAYDDTMASVLKLESLTQDISASISTIEERALTSQETLDRAVENTTIANEQILQLDDAVGSIVTILDMITDIADKTRLLALNATVEASKAGPSGKGFAVVAQEVRTLADSTQKATQSINLKIEHTVKASSSVMDILGILSGDIERLKAEQDEIKEAVKTQSKVSSGITFAAEETSKKTIGVSKSLEHIRDLVNRSEEGAEELKRSSIVLEKKASNISQKITDFTGEIN